jgi:hypothetical protein
LLPTIFKYFMALPHCCFIALLFILTPYYFALLVSIPSSLSCAS